MFTNKLCIKYVFYNPNLFCFVISYIILLYKRKWLHHGFIKINNLRVLQIIFNHLVLILYHLSFQIHPSQTRAIYKTLDSHNITVKESILKKRLRKHPRETWENWAKTLKKNKQMRWFLTGDEYTHC